MFLGIDKFGEISDVTVRGNKKDVPAEPADGIHNPGQEDAPIPSPDPRLGAQRGVFFLLFFFCDYALFAARHGTVTSTTRFRAWGPDISGITRS